MVDSITIARLSGFGRGKDATFEKPSVSLGTDAQSDVRFDPIWDKTVSALHATLDKRNDGWWITDQSRDGTWIDGRKIKQEKVQSGAVIELGKGGPRVRIGLGDSVAPRPREAIPTSSFPSRSHTIPGGTSSPAPVRSAEPRLVQNRDEFVQRRKPSKIPAWIGIAAVLLVLAVLAGIWLIRGRKNKEDDFANQRALDSRRFGDVKVLSQADPGATTDWQPVVDMDGEMFPSLIIASATMKNSPFDSVNNSPNRIGDKRAVVGVELTTAAPNSKVRVEIGENELMRPSVFEAEISTPGTYRIYPTPIYRYDVLGKIKQTTPLAITISVSLNGISLGQKATTIRVASINDCPFGVALTGSDGSSDQAVRMDWMFAAYVNENHPISDELRKEALKTGIVPAFMGYQGGADAVYKQVFAIWYVLQRRGVRYSNITTTPNTSKAVYSQYVRFIDQSINNSQANCVDGSVLFASILRQIGIDPILVLVPGHMFVGFYVYPNGQQVDFLETTMMGQLPAKSDPPKESSGFGKNPTAIKGMLEPATDTGTADKDSLECFLAAIKTARGEYTENFGGGGNAAQRSSLYKSATVRKEKANCQAIPVASAREMGVMPIGYQP